jgi:hypothetical protein
MRYPDGEDRNRVENDVEEHHGKGENPQCTIRVDPEQCLGQEFGGEQDQQGGDDGLNQQYQSLGVRIQQVGHRFFEDPGKCNTIDHERKGVASQHGGDITRRVPGEHGDDPRGKGFVFFIDLNPQLVGSEKGDFHSGKKRREKQ